MALRYGKRVLIWMAVLACCLGYGRGASGADMGTLQNNPSTTDDQTAVIERALRILQTPEVEQARKLVEFRWKVILDDDPPEQAWGSFDAMLNEYVFNYVLKASNNDPNYPKVLHVYTLPYAWRGMNVPGSRWGGDNPDNVYRIIPIDNKARYRLDVRQFGDGPSNVSYTLVGNYETSKTLNGIENTNIETSPDGSFAITLDPDPANGRPNHLQTKPGVVYLFIRDSLGDWRQRPNALSIHRLDPPDAPPMTDRQIAESAADIMVDGLPQVYWYVKTAHRGSPNVMPNFMPSGPLGGLLSQRNSKAEADLADDDALVITLNPGDAAYYSLVSHDYWYLSRDYSKHTSSLNNGQVALNSDGTVTYVVSHKDPAVYNWIDTEGLEKVPLLLRLQGLPDDTSKNEPRITSQLVKLPDLKKVLPKETKWITAEKRADQLKRRLEEYRARMADHCCRPPRP